MRAAAREWPGDAPAAEDDQRGGFAAYIAHELRTPLAIQRALLELALTDHEADTAAWREVGERVLDACRQQGRLLDACLALARSQSGLSRCEPVDLGSVVSGIVCARDPGGLRTRTRLDRAPTIGDPDLIERLVDNLLGNAIRHGTAGGWIEVITRRSGTTALLTVASAGPRIPAGEVARLFEPFQQRGGRDALRVGGLGLGLTIVKAVADAHDALLTAHARTSGGLRIEVAFPVGAQ